jgi:uncharacterized membrane protein
MPFQVKSISQDDLQSGEEQGVGVEINITPDQQSSLMLQGLMLTAVVTSAYVFGFFYMSGEIIIPAFFLIFDFLLFLAAIAALRLHSLRREHLIIYNGMVTVRYYQKEVMRDQRRFYLYGLRLERADDVSGQCLHLLLKQRDRTLELARDLNGEEKSQFADIFLQALQEASGTSKLDFVRTQSGQLHLRSFNVPQTQSSRSP